MNKFNKTGVALLVTLLGGVSATRAETMVTKVAETFDEATWVRDAYSRAPGEVMADAEAAPGASGKSTRVEVRFGTEFSPFTLTPRQPLVIPGAAKNVTIRHRISDPRAFLIVNLRDGWDRGEANGKKFEWGLKPAKDGGWATSSFDIPADWVQPIRIHGVTSHNWETKGQASTVQFWLDDLEVTTDIDPADPQTGEHRAWKPEPSPAGPDKALKASPRAPLVDIAFGTPAEANAFQGEAPSASVSIRNWRPGELKGKLELRVTSDDGAAVETTQRDIAVESAATLDVPLKAPRFGRYRLDGSFTSSDGLKREATMHFVTLAPRRELSAEEKQRSPYGLNVHGASSWPLDPYEKAGIVWFREYAFQWDWMTRARGAGDFGGWPYPHAMVKRIQDRGLHILPVLQRSISPPVIENGQVVKTGPSREWKSMLGSIVLGFPTVTHWELSNEYGLSPENARAEELCEWRNYGEYHKAFADVIDVLGGGEVVAVENGQAGIWPDRVRSQVERGYFEKIGAVNSHHYTGVEPPEVNYGNFNTGFDAMERNASLFFDDLRNASRAADADGKNREHWFTEFGWDTKAGRVVTPEQQAHYLPRAWMLLMAAGVDKGFWFYHLDAREANNFFDGCGMIDADWQPKLSLVALAGMTARLPSPEYVGDINAGPGTQGYVFRQNGKLVAALWSIHGDADAPEVTLDADRLYDFAGNAIEGNRVKLTTSPVYAEGLRASSPWHRQTAYSIDSNHLVLAAAGDRVMPVIRVENNRDEALDATIRVSVPSGWRAERGEATVSVSPGGHELVELPFVVRNDEPLGAPEVTFAIHEGGQSEPVKVLTQKLLVQPPMAVQVSSLSGAPGQTELVVKVANKSAAARDAQLALTLPATWKASPSSQTLAGLKPGEVREVPIALTWSDAWQPSETAAVSVRSGEGVPVSKAIIPSAWRLQRAEALTLDGEFGDWAPTAKVPAWMLGSTMGEADADVYLAWSPEGLYVGTEVRDSKALVSDPRNFWTGESLELWIDSANDKKPRKFAEHDHQFWFVPMIGDGRVYAGRWNRDEQIEGNRYDLAGVKGVARKTSDGYAMEFLLPASLIEGFSPKPGGHLGLNLNLSVKGSKYEREVYWSRTKADRIAEPAGWGSVELVE